MKKHLSLFGLVAVILFSACSKQPYYFTTTPVASSYKQNTAEKAPAAPVQQEAVITAEAIPAKTAEKPDVADMSATASLVIAPTVAAPKVAPAELAAPAVAERAITKKEAKLAIKEAKKEIKKAAKQEGGTSGKSQLVALLLAFFVGALGIHRFYLGYTTIGIIQLLTLGGCGIWALVDLIRIITGDLKPANGDYSEKL